MKPVFLPACAALALLGSCDKPEPATPDTGNARQTAEAAVPAADQAATRNVRIEPGTPPFPDSRCLEPTQIHNYNVIPVNVTYTLYYRGRGPGPTCQAEWSSQEQMRLERNGLPNSARWLGCGKFQYTGSPCIEERSWEVDVARPAQPLVSDNAEKK